VTKAAFRLVKKKYEISSTIRFQGRDFERAKHKFLYSKRFARLEVENLLKILHEKL